MTLTRFACCVASLSAWTVLAQDPPKVLPLWSAGAPGFESRRHEPEQAASYWVKNIHNPSLTIFLPPRGKASGTAIIVCPGGGFRELGFNGEGVAPSQFLTNLGMAAFALIEVHLFAKGGHAFNMGNRSKLATIRGWPNRMADWLTDSGLLPDPASLAP